MEDPVKRTALWETLHSVHYGTLHILTTVVASATLPFTDMLVFPMLAYSICESWEHDSIRPVILDRMLG